MSSNPNAARTPRIDTAADQPGGRAKSTTIRRDVHSDRRASTDLIATARGLRAPPAPSRQRFEPHRNHVRDPLRLRAVQHLSEGRFDGGRCGRIRFKNRKVNLGQVFAGQQVGVRQVDERLWLVTFMHYDLGYFDDETCRLEPIANPFGPKVLPMSPE
jgi:putative transposase